MASTSHEIAGPLSDLLASVMLAAHRETRGQLYCWEQKSLRWLLAYGDKYMPKGKSAPICDWTWTFCLLNRDLITSERIGPIDFNLRAFNERRIATPSQFPSGLQI